jgi:predicted ribosomally synthesized peptide with SipW-like signal peptide
MRLSRSSRHKHSFRLPLKQIAVVVAVSACIFAQLATPTYAVFTSSETKEARVTTAFVFPRTVDEIAQSSVVEMKKTMYYRDTARSVLQLLLDKEMKSHAAEKKLHIIGEALVQTRQTVTSMALLVEELENYSVQAQHDIELQEKEMDLLLSPYGITFEQLKVARKEDFPLFQKLLDEAGISLIQFEEMDREFNSISRVTFYVQAAYEQAVTAFTQSGSYLDEILGMHTHAITIIEEKKQAEEKEKEKEKEEEEKEEEEKEKKGVDDNPKNEDITKIEDNPKNEDVTDEDMDVEIEGNYDFQ